MMQMMMLNKQLLILQSIKDYLPFEKQQLEAFNFINNNLNELQSGTYHLDNVTLEIQMEDDMLIASLYGIKNVTYIFSLEGKEIVDYQLQSQ